MNYCIGTFGWLLGPAFQASNGTANVSLYDQRLALEWIQEHIHYFRDDPNGEHLDHEELYNTLPRKGNATSLADLRVASSPNLIAANQALLFNNTYESGRNSNAADVPYIPVLR